VAGAERGDHQPVEAVCGAVQQGAVLAEGESVSPNQSPRRAPVIIVSQTNVPRSSSIANASSMISAASSADGGCGFGLGARGFVTDSIGLTRSQSQRMAALNAPFRMTWICRRVDFPSGRHVCGLHRLSHR